VGLLQQSQAPNAKTSLWLQQLLDDKQECVLLCLLVAAAEHLMPLAGGSSSRMVRQIAVSYFRPSRRVRLLVVPSSMLWNKKKHHRLLE
jgi:hypothetical protein